MIIVWVKDLFFGSKIETEARAHQASCCFVEKPHDVLNRIESTGSTLVLVDLNASPRTVDTIRDIKNNPDFSEVRIIGFLSHVQTDLAEKARIAGCDVVMPRSLFANRLPEIFESHQEVVLSV